MSKANKKREPYIKFYMFLKENEIPQAEIAELLKKSVSAVNQNINGTGGDLTVSEVTKICMKYGISAEKYFF